MEVGGEPTQCSMESVKIYKKWEEAGDPCETHLGFPAGAYQKLLPFHRGLELGPYFQVLVRTNGKFSWQPGVSSGRPFKGNQGHPWGLR